MDKNNRFFNKISVKLIKNENLLDTYMCNEQNEDFPPYQILIKAIKSDRLDLLNPARYHSIKLLSKSHNKK